MARFHTLEFDDLPPRKPALQAEEREDVTAAGNLTSSVELQHRDTATRDVIDEHYHMRCALDEYQKGNFEAAMRLYSRALQDNPNRADAWVGQVRMLIEMGELKEAGVWADRALEVNPGHGELLAAKGVAATRLGDRKAAIGFIDAASASPQGGSFYVWLARGEVLLATRRKNVDFALDQAISLARDWFSRLLVARIYYFYRQYARALVHARAAVEANLLSPFAWLVQGNCQLALAMSRDARRSYQEALNLDRDFLPARKALESRRPISALTSILSPLRRLLRR